MGKYDRQCDVVVVGSGMGGLISALALAKEGKNVEIIEQGARLGGYFTDFKRNNFYFEPCLHVLGECEKDGLLNNILEELGLRDKIEFDKVSYTLVTPKGSIILPTNPDEIISVLLQQFPDEEKGLKEFLNTTKVIHDDFLKFLSPSPVIEKYKDKTFKELLDEFLKSEELKHMLLAAWLFLQVPPSKASAITSSVFEWIYLFSQGGFWPRGGSKAVLGAFSKELEKAQTRMTLKTKVTKIVVENGRAVGVETEKGERIKADFVISNAAARQTFLDLVGEKELDNDFTNDLKQKGIALSSFCVFLGVEMDLEKLNITSQIFVNNSPKSYDEDYEDVLKGEVSDYIILTIPTLLDPGISTGRNKHSVTIYTYSPYRLEGRDWKTEREKVTDKIIRKAEEVIPDLSKHILVKNSATPLTMERYTLNTEGATTGWRQTPETTIGRPQQKSPIENLFLVGHWTMPGGGYMLAAKSGIDAAKLILNFKTPGARISNDKMI